MEQRETQMTQEELRALPPAVTVEVACRALSISPGFAYKLIRDQQFPVTVHKIGRKFRVPTASLLRYLGVQDAA